MRALLLTVGDEILIGQIVNTNAAWMGEQLSLLGVEVRRSETVGDVEDEILDALARARGDVDLVIITGGLGPTHDDVTKTAVARFAGVELVEDGEVLAGLERYFLPKYGRLPMGNREMALVPDGFEVLANPIGTAPGLWGQIRGEGAALDVVMLPGVPAEMEALMETAVLPRLRSDFVHQTIRHRTLLTAGIGESNLAQHIGDLSDLLDERVRLAYLPNPRSGVRLRISATAPTPGEADAAVARVEARLRERAGRFVYGAERETLEAVVGRLLRERDATIAFAESCTGGLASSRMTDVPGASAYVLGGVVAYCNSAKIRLLGVDPDTLDAHGAVSEAVARQMAEGARDRFGAGIAISTTGIAGPGGGTPDKPVGLVWIGYADAEGSRAVRVQLARERMLNKELAATFALNLVRRRLLKETPDFETV